MQRVWHADRGRLLLVPSLWDLHMFYLLRPIIFPNFLSLFFRTMLFEYPSVLSRFCFTTIVDRLRKVSWSNYSHSSGGVYRVSRGPTFELPATVLKLKEHIFKFVNSPPQRDQGRRLLHAGGQTNPGHIHLSSEGTI